MSSINPQNPPAFHWQSRSAFIVVMIGVTLSMKDFLVFPVMAAEHGGGAYILLYAACLLLLGLPLLVAELLIGRQSNQYIFPSLTNSFQCSKHWQMIVSLSILASILVLSIYNVIAGWSLSFVFKTAAGLFANSDKESINVLLNAFQSDPERMMLWHTLFIIILLIMSAQGIKIGLQKVFMVIVPMMVFLLLIGLIYAMVYGDYLNSVKYLLLPDFSKINLSVMLIAMQHAFYTLSVGLGIFLILGSKMRSDIPIVYSGITIVLIDLLFSILTGLAIHSFVFTLDVMPSLNDELAFSLLPLIFSQLPFGQLFGVLFYLLLTIAAITTAVALLEVFVSYITQKFNFTRIKAAVYASLLTWIIGVIIIFSYTIWQESGFTIELYMAGEAHRLVNDAGFADVLIYVASHLLQPFIAFLMIIFIAWVVKKEELALLLNIKNAKVFAVVYFTFRYITPTFIFIVWLFSLGIISHA